MNILNFFMETFKEKAKRECCLMEKGKRRKGESEQTKAFEKPYVGW